MTSIPQNGQNAHATIEQHAPQNPDRIYAATYLERLFTETTVEPPDDSRLGSLLPAIQALYAVYGKQEGLNRPSAAREVFDALSRNLPELASLVSPQTLEQKLIYTAAEFMERPPRKFLDKEKLIPERSLVMLYGEPGAGKSLWMMRKLAKIAKDRPVFFILGEGEGGMPDRLRAEEKAQGEKLSEHLYIYSEEVNLTDPSAVQTFIDNLRPYKPELIAFDTLSTCMVGGDENSPKDMPVVIAHCKLIRRELSTAIMLVHHSRKDGKTYRGHSSLHGHVDAMYLIEQGSNGLITLSCEKSKDSRKSDPEYYRVVSFPTRQDPDTGEDITGAALMPNDKVLVEPNQRLTHNERKVLEALDNCPEGLRYHELQTRTGISSSGSLSDTRKALTRLGYVRHETDSKLYQITEPGKAILHPEVQEVQNRFN